MPIYPAGNTRNYFPVQHHPEFEKADVERRWEGILNGWLPAVKKILPMPDGSYYEALVFAEVNSKKPHITDTWHRTSRIRNGSVVERSYGFFYPDFPSFREAPKPEKFYLALLRFTSYWGQLTNDTMKAQLPMQWHELCKHSFVRELISRQVDTIRAMARWMRSTRARCMTNFKTPLETWPTVHPIRGGIASFTRFGSGSPRLVVDAGPIDLRRPLRPHLASCQRKAFQPWNRLSLCGLRRPSPLCPARQS